MGPRKIVGWQDRLSDYLREADGKPFNWAMNSCLTFATGAVTAMTGVDPWKDERDRLRGLRRRGRVIQYMHQYGGDLEGAADKSLRLAGYTRKTCPGEGDIVLARVDKAIALGVCLGRRCAFVSPYGLTRGKPHAILAAWGI